MLTPQTIDPYLVPQIPPQQIPPSRLLDDVMYDPRGPRHYELPILEIGQIADDPLLGLCLLEATPLVRREESVLVVDVQDLTEQSCDLGLGTDGVETQLETDGEGVVVLSLVRTHRVKPLLYSFLVGRVGTGKDQWIKIKDTCGNMVIRGRDVKISRRRCFSSPHPKDGHRNFEPSP